MKTSIAVAALLAVLLLRGVVTPPPVHAGSSQDAALALGAFAVFNQLIRGETVLHDIFGRRQTVVVHQPPPVIYAPPPPPPTVIYAPPPPPVVVYPGGHWFAQNGSWVWIPNGYPHYQNGYHNGHYKKKHWNRHKKHDEDDD